MSAMTIRELCVVSPVHQCDNFTKLLTGICLQMRDVCDIPTSSVSLSHFRQTSQLELLTREKTPATHRLHTPGQGAILDTRIREQYLTLGAGDVQGSLCATLPSLSS